MKPLKPCVLCNKNTRSRLLFPSVQSWERTLRAKEYYSPTDNAFGIHSEIIKCHQCGLVYCNSHLAERTLRNAYQDVVDKYYLEEEKQRTRTFKLYLKHIRPIYPNGKLLEIGSNAGFFLNLAKKAGYDVRGIEPNKWAASYARKRFHLKLINQAVDEVQVPAAPFDVVVLFDVVEHLYDPLRTLKRISRWVKKGGGVFLTTPDVNGLFAKIQGRNWYGFRQQHLYYFSKETLQVLLRKAGLKPVFFKYLPHHFTVEYLIKQMKFPFLKLITLLGMNKLTVRINLFDHFFVYAKKL